MKFRIAAVTLCLFAVSSCEKSTAPVRSERSTAVRELPGQKSDGSILLPNQWSLRPAGKQIPVGDFPVNIAMHPGGKYAAVLHCGHSQHEVVVLEVGGGKIISRTMIDEAFYGLAFSNDGSRIYCSGASSESIHTFTFANGYLTNPEPIQIRDAKEKAIPSGIAVSPDGKRLFAAQVWGHRVSELNLETKTNAGDIVLESAAPLKVVAPADKPINPDEAAITKRAEALQEKSAANDPFPYACAFDEKNNRLFVSQWNLANVAVIDAKTRTVTARWATEDHPNEMLLTKNGKYLFVANANRNTVTVLDTEKGQARETLYAALYPNMPPGATPNSLALSPDEKTLYVANATLNTVAVFDVSDIGHSRSVGFIPVGWYPTSVRVTLDGKKLIVANGKGIMSKPNRNASQPGQPETAPASMREYIGSLMQGTVSIIDLPVPEKFEEQIKKWTGQVYACSPLKSDLSTVKPKSGGPVPLKVGDASPIKYVIYMIKENRTYDQVLGDMPQGNGDPSLCLFPEAVTPNHHALARDFVLLDNFYVDAEVSADGHEWTVGGYATDFVEKQWPLTYGHNQSKKYPYPSEGNFKIAQPSGGYIWDRAREAGVSYRSYGEFISNGKTVNDPGTTRVPSLEGHFDPWFRGFDMDYPDVKRADRFIAELRRFESEGEMPRLQLVRLPNDHTSGSAKDKLTPTAYLGDNDLAFGRIIEALSHSRFWTKTAVFVIEDDAQNGPDHVDAHRSIAYVISPYTRNRGVDSTMYSTTSMLRTMELILGLKPLSQFDAAATPMYNAFNRAPDLRPYKTIPVTVDLKAKNLATAWGSDFKLDMSKEDAADDIVFNEVIWRAVRGNNSRMPAPVRAGFVFTRPGAHDDDDDDDDDD